MSLLEAKTYRGRDVTALLPTIREEMGEDAVVVATREARMGGMGGFFAQRVFELDVRTAASMELDFDGPISEALADAAAPSEVERIDRATPGSDLHIGPTYATRGQTLDVRDDEGSAFPALLRDAVAAADVPGEWADLIADGGPLAALAAPSVELPRPSEADSTLGISSLDVERAIAAAAAPAPPQHRGVPAEAGSVRLALEARGMSSSLAAELVGETVDHLLPFASDRALRPLLAGQIARRVPVMARRTTGGFVAGFVGPGGSGKTRCVARLALAYGTRGPGRVACVTLRPKDGGAELRALLGPTGIPVVAIDTPGEAARRIGMLSDQVVVLVDTPGVSPRAEAELRILSAELRQLQLDECHLMLPATTGAHAARELVAGMRSLGVDALALTHADETEHVGAAVEAAIGSGLPLSYVGRGPGLRGALVPAQPDLLAAALVA